MQASGKKENGKTFMDVLGMDDDTWNRVRGVGSKTGDRLLKRDVNVSNIYMKHSRSRRVFFHLFEALRKVSL